MRSSPVGRRLTEAWDFRASGLPIATDMARIVGGHRTPVLAHAPLDRFRRSRRSSDISPMPKSNLALAAGREPVGSLALYRPWGSRRPRYTSRPTRQNLTIAGEQMACYQASLMVDERNFRAAP